MTTRRHQPVAAFRPGSPAAGYYNDLTRYAKRHRDVLATATNPVTVAQIGLGAWQLTAHDPRWVGVVADSARWLTEHMDRNGMLPYEFAMPHTYQLRPPWYSAMAQGEAASFLLRAADVLGTSALRDAAGRAVACLTEPDTALVVVTEDGPVLQEYPTDPPAHVLNGWIFALWGLYDTALAGPNRVADQMMVAFEDGVTALSRRLSHYQLPGGWSRYDLIPAEPVNVASPFYHHLHISQLIALSRLVDEPVFGRTAALWQRARRNPVTYANAVAAKVRFRRRHPRSRRV